MIDRPYHNAFVYMGEDDAMGKYSTGFYSKHFISYVMQRFDSLNLANGYIEIKRSMESVLASAIHYNSVYGEEVYIVDGSGTLVFPVESELPEHLTELAAGEIPETVGLHVEAVGAVVGIAVDVALVGEPDVAQAVVDHGAAIAGLGLQTDELIALEAVEAVPC